jgi:hypothetical protein
MNAVEQAANDAFFVREHSNGVNVPAMVLAKSTLPVGSSTEPAEVTEAVQVVEAPNSRVDGEQETFVTLFENEEFSGASTVVEDSNVVVLRRVVLFWVFAMVVNDETGILALDSVKVP